MDAEHCVLMLDTLPKAPHESLQAHLSPSVSPSVKQTDYLLEREGWTRTDRVGCHIGLESPLGQPAGLPTGLKGQLVVCKASNIPAAFAKKKVTLYWGTWLGEDYERMVCLHLSSSGW